MRDVRIRFSKTGVAKYISHLDLMRCFSRAFVRAGIPLWYTEGFNPRPYLNFTSPLSLGVEGLQECVDIRVEGDMTDDEIAARLAAAMPPDIAICSAAPPTYKMNAIEASRYRFTIEQHAVSAEELAEAIRRVAAEPHLTVFKTAKHGKEKIQKEIDLKEYLTDFSAEAGGEEGAPEGTVTVHVTLPSSPRFGVNPKLFIDRFLSGTGTVPDRLRMVREELYVADGRLFC